jgi:hypothetical protein
MMSLLLLSLAFGTESATPGTTWPHLDSYLATSAAVCPVPDTTGVKIMGKFARSSQAVAPQATNVIKRYVEAVASGRQVGSLMNTTQIPPETQTSCASAIAKLANAPGCSEDPLYPLENGEIRQVWLCSGETAYVVFYAIDAGKLTSIRAVNTPPAMMIRRR